jgi:hypothetical protein
MIYHGPDLFRLGDVKSQVAVVSHQSQDDDHDPPFFFLFLYTSGMSLISVYCYYPSICCFIFSVVSLRIHCKASAHQSKQKDYADLNMGPLLSR